MINISYSNKYGFSSSSSSFLSFEKNIKSSIITTANDVLLFAWNSKANFNVFLNGSEWVDPVVCEHVWRCKLHYLFKYLFESKSIHKIVINQRFEQTNYYYGRIDWFPKWVILMVLFENKTLHHPHWLSHEFNLNI